MDCLVKEDAEGIAQVTFLYKFVGGACPKSYGLNVARLAHLPESVILRAKQRSEDFELAVEDAKRAAAAAGDRPLPPRSADASLAAGASPA